MLFMRWKSFTSQEIQDNQEEECRFWKHYSLSRGRADLLCLELCFLYQLCENAVQASIQIRQLSISKHPSLPCIPAGHACPLDRNDISTTSCGGRRRFTGLNTFWIWLESAPDLSERQSSKMPMASRSPFQDPGSPLLADIWGELSGKRASYSTSKCFSTCCRHILAKAPTIRSENSMAQYNCLTSFDKSTFFAADSSDAAIANTVRPVQHRVGASDLYLFKCLLYRSHPGYSGGKDHPRVSMGTSIVP